MSWLEHALQTSMPWKSNKVFKKDILSDTSYMTGVCSYEEEGEWLSAIEMTKGERQCECDYAWLIWGKSGYSLASSVTFIVFYTRNLHSICFFISPLQKSSPIPFMQIRFDWKSQKEFQRSLYMEMIVALSGHIFTFRFRAFGRHWATFIRKCFRISNKNISSC